jgi:hypothetical protein
LISMRHPKALQKTGRARQLKILAVLCLLSASLPAFGENQKPYLENRLAKEELLLAKTPTLYFVICVKSKMIALKSRGMVLQEWPIKSIHGWGDGMPLGAVTLEKKSTLFPPKRKKIVPAAKEEDVATFELDALELKDMPSRFTLFLGGGIRVNFRSQAHGLLPRLGSFGHFLAWNLWVPLKNLSYRLRNKPFSALDINLGKKEDSQAVYWAFADGIKGLVFPL